MDTTTTTTTNMDTTTIDGFVDTTTQIVYDGPARLRTNGRTLEIPKIRETQKFDASGRMVSEFACTHEGCEFTSSNYYAVFGHLGRSHKEGRPKKEKVPSAVSPVVEAVEKLVDAQVELRVTSIQNVSERRRKKVRTLEQSVRYHRTRNEKLSAENAELKRKLKETEQKLNAIRSAFA
jgi:hypothetical protein